MTASHVATIRWRRGDAGFAGQRYSRAHTWSFDGGLTVPASSSPHVVPLPMSEASAVDPEEAYVAALASCHMLWFLDIAARAGFVVDRYDDVAEGRLGRNAAGQAVVDLVTLRPRTRFSGAKVPDADRLAALHHAAHAECFLANSVRTGIRCEPSFA